MADDLAALLDILHDSDNRWGTRRAEGDQWSDEERSREAFLRRVPPGAVVSSRGRPPAPHRPRQGPPDGVLGEPVACRTVVARTDDAVIAVDRLVAYPTGFELGITVRTHEQPVFGTLHEGRVRSWSGSAAFPGESLRVGVVFADGRRSFVENFPLQPTTAGDISLVPIRGGGSQSRYDQSFWVAPLPPAGQVGVVVEWERRGVPETRVDLDAGAVLEAATKAETLWPERTSERGAEP